MLVRESHKKKNEGVGSIPLPSFKTIGIIALIIIIWLTWDSGNTESTSAPFYTTWWFWTLVVLFILSTTFLIWNFVSKKKKQEKLRKDKEKNRNHDDNHTDPEVEKHTNDDHAHHGDTLYTTASVWIVKLFIFAVVVTVSYFGIKYIFFNNYVTAYPGHESKRIRLVEKNLLGIQKSYYVKIVLDENQRVQVKCYNTGNDGTNIATYSQEIVYGHEYPPFPSALYYTVRSTNGKTFKVDYTRTEVVKP